MSSAAATFRVPRFVPPTQHAGPEIFSINLIRRQILPWRVRRVMVAAVLGYLALNLACTAVLVGIAYRDHAQQRRLQRALQGEMTSAAAANALKQEMMTLRDRAQEDLAQLNAMISLQHYRFPIGLKLASLVKTLPARTWMNSLSADRETRIVTVKAMYVIDPDRPFELPAKGWIESLQADPYFSRGLKQLALGDSSRKMQGQTELFCFSLIAEWQP